MNGQAWTKKRPTAPGWYWRRREGAVVQIVRVIRGPAGYALVEQVGTDQYATACHDGVEWQGPLVPNETRGDARAAGGSDRPTEGRQGPALVSLNERAQALALANLVLRSNQHRLKTIRIMNGAAAVVLAQQIMEKTCGEWVESRAVDGAVIDKIADEYRTLDRLGKAGRRRVTDKAERKGK